MRALFYALAAIVSSGILAACAGSNSSTNPAAPQSAAVSQSHLDGNGHFVPQWSRFGLLIPKGFVPLGRQPLHGKPAPLRIQPAGNVGGVYVSEFYGSSVFGYPHNNMADGAPTCSISTGVVNPQGIAADKTGNFIFPQGYNNLGRQVQVYAGPSLCGAMVGFLNDDNGQPVDASSADAVNGNIAVANMFDVGGAGSVSICTLSSGGCATNLTNANMYEVASVVMSSNGDCWASGANQTGAATLTYFQGCTGSGAAATGYANTYFGGLDIDKNGNIVALSAFDAKLYIYHGCNPTCTMVGGPFSLQGQSLFGHLNRQSMTYTAADFEFGQIDVYQYSSSGPTYWYSYNNGLTASNIVEGVAVAPRTKR